jgi:hypothetical protein
MFAKVSIGLSSPNVFLVSKDKPGLKKNAYPAIISLRHRYEEFRRCSHRGLGEKVITEEQV